jgi:hypothetical protein
VIGETLSNINLFNPLTSNKVSSATSSLNMLKRRKCGLKSLNRVAQLWSGRASWVQWYIWSQSQLFGSLRQENHLNPGVPNQPGQHNKTFQKIKNEKWWSQYIN